MKKKLLVMSLVGVLALGLGSFAFADDTPESSTIGQGLFMHGAHRSGDNTNFRANHKRHNPLRGMGPTENIEIFADLSDMSKNEVLTLMQEEQLPLHELAEEYGISDEFNAQMLDKHKERMNALVEDGRLTEEEAQERIEAFENGDFQQHGPQSRRQMKGFGNREGVSILSTLTGLTDDEIIEQKVPLHEIAEDNGVLDEFNAQMLDSHKERINALVEDGRLTEEEAQERIEAFENGEHCQNPVSMKRGFRKRR